MKAICLRVALFIKQKSYSVRVFCFKLQKLQNFLFLNSLEYIISDDYYIESIINQV